jgi:hypothetical protein
VTDYLGLLAQCEDLYAGVCFEPATWPDAALADWINGVAESGEVDKETARELRRVLRSAQKLRRFWETPPASLPPDHGDFRTRVDIAVGPGAWRPLLAMARHGLAETPDSELFDEVKERFRVVAGEHWMEGVSYAEWLEAR